MSKGHIFSGFVGGVTNHETLISSTEIFNLIIFDYTLVNFGALDIHINNNGSVLKIHPSFNIGIADFFDGSSHNLFIIDLMK